jgi:hypothetical protein
MLSTGRHLVSALTVLAILASAPAISRAEPADACSCLGWQEAGPVIGDAPVNPPIRTPQMLMCSAGTTRGKVSFNLMAAATPEQAQTYFSAGAAAVASSPAYSGVHPEADIGEEASGAAMADGGGAKLIARKGPLVLDAVARAANIKVDDLLAVLRAVAKCSFGKL